MQTFNFRRYSYYGIVDGLSLHQHELQRVRIFVRVQYRNIIQCTLEYSLKLYFFLTRAIEIQNQRCRSFCRKVKSFCLFFFPFFTLGLVRHYIKKETAPGNPEVVKWVNTRKEGGKVNSSRPHQFAIMRLLFTASLMKILVCSQLIIIDECKGPRKLGNIVIVWM